MASALVVNADDLGVSRGATLGIIKAHREGIVTSASLAVTTPFYQHAVDSCVRACPGLGIGLHFTLTSGMPVTDAKQVPLLVDENGFLRWRFTSLLSAVSVQKNADLLSQIELELEAQLARLHADGIDPDHIDGERHIQLIPGIFEKVVRAAKRHDIHFVRAGRDIGLESLRTAHLPGLVMQGGFVKTALLSGLSSLARPRLSGEVATSDYVASYLYTGRVDLMMKGLLSMPPRPGVTEMMVHPGIPEESRGIDFGNPEIERYLVSEDRRSELNACIEARGWPTRWELTNFTRLAESRTAG